ncbi:MAG: DUF6783 domain-containing protein [Ruminococcus sp.]
MREVEGADGKKCVAGYARACLKNHSCNLHALLCYISYSDLVAVVHYSN